MRRECGAPYAPNVRHLGCILVAAFIFFQPLTSVAAPQEHVHHQRPALRVGLHIKRAGLAGDEPHNLHGTLATAVDGGAVMEDPKPREVIKQRWAPNDGRLKGSGRGGNMRKMEGEEGFGTEVKVPVSDDDKLESGPTGNEEAHKARESCKSRPFLNDTWLLSAESESVSVQRCRSLRRVCMDQSAFILYGHKYRPKELPFPELPSLDITFLRVDGPTNPLPTNSPLPFSRITSHIIRERLKVSRTCSVPFPCCCKACEVHVFL